MGTSTKPTAKEHALEYLRAKLAGGEWHDGDRLPTAVELAKAARVSVNAMLAAVGVLRAEGRLTVRRKRGIVVGAAGANLPLSGRSVRTAARWEEVRGQLEADILTGAFRGDDVLPPPKQLAAFYGACYRTLRRALASLQAGGLVRPHKRTYLAIRPAATQSRNTVAVLVDPQFAVATPGKQSFGWQTEFMRTLERTCLRRRLSLKVVPYHEVEGPGMALHREPSLVGTILWRPQHMAERFGGVLSSLLALRRRVAVYYDSPPGQQVSAAQARRGVRVFCIDQRGAGRKLGTYLRSLGHRRIAFFSPFPAAAWANERLGGLTEAFGGSGDDGVVRAVTPQVDGRHGPGASLGTGLAGGPMYHAPGDAAGALKDCLRVLRSSGYGADDDGALRGAVLDIVERSELQRRVSPGALAELASGECTAWVGANDKVALVLLDLLKQRRVRVPKALSVAGFDDSVEGMKVNLSSHNFDMAGIALRMLNYLLQSLGPMQREAFGVEAVGGYVVARGTTAASQARS